MHHLVLVELLIQFSSPLELVAEVTMLAVLHNNYKQSSILLFEHIFVLDNVRAIKCPKKICFELSSSPLSLG